MMKKGMKRIAKEVNAALVCLFDPNRREEIAPCPLPLCLSEDSGRFCSCCCFCSFGSDRIGSDQTGKGQGKGGQEENKKLETETEEGRRKKQIKKERTKEWGGRHSWKEEWRPLWLDAQRIP